MRKEDSSDKPSGLRITFEQGGLNGTRYTCDLSETGIEVARLADMFRRLVLHEMFELLMCHDCLAYFESPAVQFGENGGQTIMLCDECHGKREDEHTEFDRHNRVVR